MTGVLFLAVAACLALGTLLLIARQR